MSSVQTYKNCVVCHGIDSFVEDYNYRTHEIFGHCMRCGVNFEMLSDYDEDGYAILTDGKTDICVLEAYPTSGAYRIRNTVSDIISGGSLKYGFTRDDVEKLIHEIKEDGFEVIFLSLWENDNLSIIIGSSSRICFHSISEETMRCTICGKPF